jgi:hypothetical protein
LLLGHLLGEIEEAPQGLRQLELRLGRGAVALDGDVHDGGERTMRGAPEGRR